jgi:hypothetical protein
MNANEIAISLTENQKSFLKKMAFHEMTPLNGARPASADDTENWADCIIETSADKGTFTSLMNKGLVDHNGAPGRDAGVAMTDLGFEVFTIVFPE